MPVYFIETIVDANHDPDRIGTTFHDADGAMKAALWALLDIVQDEAYLQTELDVTVVVKDLHGDPIFNATLSAGKRLRSEVRTEIPVKAELPTPAYRLSA